MFFVLFSWVIIITQKNLFWGQRKRGERLEVSLNKRGSKVKGRICSGVHTGVWDRCLGSIAVARDNLMDVNCDSVLRNRRKLESLEQWLLGTHLLVLSGKPLEILSSFSHSPSLHLLWSRRL